MSPSTSDILRSIADVINSNERFLVASHVKPDGDAVGSLLAMTSLLRKLGKTAVPHLEDPVPPNYTFLPGAQDVVGSTASARDYDVAITVDCGDPSRVGKDLEQTVSSIPILVHIDHHQSTEVFSPVQWVDTTASSTCELIYRLSLALGTDLDFEIATQLYTGMVTDTGSFRFSNTSREVLEIAAVLVGAGADPSYISENIYDSSRPQRLLLLARVLGTVRFLGDDRLATGELTQRMFEETGTSPVESEGFINELRSVKTVTLAIIFREGRDNIVHVSMRSKADVDVARLARAHGGGGHRRAAAFRVQGALSEIRESFTRTALEYLLEKGEGVGAPHP